MKVERQSEGVSLSAAILDRTPPSLDQVRKSLVEKPFRPHPLFRGQHAQTLMGHVWPRRHLRRSHVADERRFFRVEADVRVLAHCRWQKQRTAHPTLILLHGLEGSSASVYMLGTTDKAFRAGFNVLRLNMRNCGGTEHLTRTLYNSGLTSDLRHVVYQLIEQDRLPQIFLAVF